MCAEQSNLRSDHDVDLGKGTKHGEGDSDPRPPCEYGLDVVAVVQGQLLISSVKDVEAFSRPKQRRIPCRWTRHSLSVCNLGRRLLQDLVEGEGVGVLALGLSALPVTTDVRELAG